MTNVFRPAYRELSDEEKAKINDIKDKAQELLGLYPVSADGRAADRETSLAITKLEESVMWVVKSLTK